ncbi:hypothetical protein CONPUDRAFT_78570 [Coniophora puteana RWD-64-598 SS2]|uniref:Uncharacterized protein n=1 Tax=Coniophora puteana (strain RWD-64-598) TaxID=741705 RepID=A0A5M3N3I9_CONPW|nr:uncharacterized protein CONPUDRAFT_78570 [Coniophora puteana RWD-64-598 SS2]EIW85989.1 hypothetical protein CONPUDRAFT_78570 [Coniophora puteana RWD-64-598 SS2]
MGGRVRLPQTFSELPLAVRLFTFRYLCRRYPVLRLCHRNWKAQRVSEGAYSSMIATYQSRYEKAQGLAESEKNGTEEERATKRARIECASGGDSRSNSVVPETPSQLSSSSTSSLDGTERHPSAIGSPSTTSSDNTSEQPASPTEDAHSTFSVDANERSTAATEESRSDFPSDINQPPSSWRFQRRRLADNRIDLSESIDLSSSLSSISPPVHHAPYAAAPLSATGPENSSDHASGSEATSVPPVEQSESPEQPVDTIMLGSVSVTSPVETPAAEDTEVQTSSGRGGAPMPPPAESCAMHMYYANWPLKGKGTKYALSRDFKKLSEEEKLVYEKKYKEAKEMKVGLGKRKRNTT